MYCINLAHDNELECPNEVFGLYIVDEALHSDIWPWKATVLIKDHCKLFIYIYIYM